MHDDSLPTIVPLCFAQVGLAASVSTSATPYQISQYIINFTSAICVAFATSTLQSPLKSPAKTSLPTVWSSSTPLRESIKGNHNASAETERSLRFKPSSSSHRATARRGEDFDTEMAPISFKTSSHPMEIRVDWEREP
jgi:hypothetical protein